MSMITTCESRRFLAYNLSTRGKLSPRDLGNCRLTYRDGDLSVLALLRSGDVLGRVYRDGKPVGRLDSRCDRSQGRLVEQMVSEAMLFSNLLPIELLPVRRLLSQIADSIPVRVDIRGGCPIDLWLRPNGELLCAALIFPEQAITYRPLNYEMVTRKNRVCSSWARNDGQRIDLLRIAYRQKISVSEMPD